MPINNSYNEAAIVEAIATALDNFYTNLIKKVDSLNVKTVMKRKNPYLFRAKAMNGAAQIIDAILAAFVSSSEETIFGNVFFEPIATAAAQGQKRQCIEKVMHLPRPPHERTSAVPPHPPGTGCRSG